MRSPEGAAVLLPARRCPCSALLPSPHVTAYFYCSPRQLLPLPAGAAAQSGLRWPLPAGAAAGQRQRQGQGWQELGHSPAGAAQGTATCPSTRAGRSCPGPHVSANVQRSRWAPPPAPGAPSAARSHRRPLPALPAPGAARSRQRSAAPSRAGRRRWSPSAPEGRGSHCPPHATPTSGL